MTVRFLDVAQQELREAVDFYELQQPGLGIEFSKEIQSAVERIIAYPEAWQSISPRLRRCRIRRFPYAVDNQEILIVAVPHLHRSPRSWNDRG